MLKKLTLAVLAASVSTVVYAQDVSSSQSTDNQSVQAQIAELKKEIAALQANQEALSSSKKTSSSVTSFGEDSEHVTVPTNQGQIQNFLFSDVQQGVVPMGMLSSSQFALGLLKQRNKYSDYGLIFGGYLEIDAQTWNGSTIPAISTNNGPTGDNTNNYQSGKGIYITTANLYTAANLGRYVTTEMTLATDQNNNFRVNDGLVVFGNLDDYPLYATVGKNRIPLGSFSGGGPWTGSLTQMLFRPGRVINASLAYYQYGLSTNVTFFQTDDHTSNFSYAAFYGNTAGEWGYGINGGYLYNVNGTNNSFNAATNLGTTKTRIGAVNFDASLNYDVYGVGAGWAQTTNKSSITNNGYAGAWYVQAGFSPEIYGRSTNFNISYNGSYNTNDIPVTLSGSAVNEYKPANVVAGGVNKMVVASAQRPFFTENVLLGLEYAYMHMYNNQHANAYTLDISVYF
ncbi:LbtU family siderophore porin [Fastidiosibacter lacustris]|uniref:LbtU family siderophore porin n=1 Tax=Fastidiosibacter lacustris TaxID=2056695 RepID=UPI000E353B7C|nr:LbtU family siderophore porin [Fastidiosibacter lacustris]